MARIQIKEGSLKKCICTKCGQYLSYPPVVIYKNEHFHEQCCEITSETSDGTRRASEYEELATYFQFPCLNDSGGCTKYMQFGEGAKEHLKTCPYRPVECPFSESQTCGWKGSTPNLEKHFVNNHPDGYLGTPSFEIDCAWTGDKYYVVGEKDQVVVLQLRCDALQKKIWLNAIRLPAVLAAHSAEYSVTLTPVNALEPSLKFAANTVNLITSTSINSSLCQQINTTTLLDIFQTSNIRCTWALNILPQIEALKCNECDTFLVPPIFQCKSGHVICEVCKSSETCMECEDPVSIARDLEAISRNVKYPCILRCGTFHDYSNIREHEKICIKRFSCQNCGEYIVSPFITCLRKHVFCGFCSKPSSGCIICKAELTVDSKMQETLKNGNFVCRWCNDSFTAKRIRDHESSHPPKPCPDCHIPIRVLYYCVCGNYDCLECCKKNGFKCSLPTCRKSIKKIKVGKSSYPLPRFLIQFQAFL